MSPILGFEVPEFKSDHDAIIAMYGEILRLGTLIEQREEKYVTREAFKPVRNIVYGMVTLILTGFAIAIVYTVIPLSQNGRW
jgi:hypothetical protein